MPEFESKHIRVEEVEVEEVNHPFESDLNRNLELGNTRVETAQKAWQEAKTEKNPKKKYAAFMFLFSMFIGLGFTASFGEPIFLFVGLGTGFLAFIDPLYEKIMEKINNL